MQRVLICYKNCSTCTKAKKYLSEHEISYRERDIKADNPTKIELKKWLDRSTYSIKKFFNTSGKLYRELNLKERLVDMSEEEQLEILSSDGMLVKRPIIIDEDVVLVGFNEREWGKLKK